MRDTLDAILNAPDRDELLDWLRRRPLVVREGELLLVHAGLLPRGRPRKAVTLSREVEAMLASEQQDDFLHSLYGDQPARWDDALTGLRPPARHRQRLHAAAFLLPGTTR